MSFPRETLPENPKRAIILASALVATVTLSCFLTIAWQSNELFYAFIMRLTILACASYLIQKDGAFYKATAIGTALIMLITNIISYIAAGISSGYDIELKIHLALFVTELTIATTVVAAGFLATKLVQSETRKQTTIAALLCGGVYLIVNTITHLVFNYIFRASDYIFRTNDLQYVIIFDGFGSIPDAIWLGVAVKLISMLCLLRSKRLQLSVGVKVWFGVCASVTSLILLITLLNLYTNAIIPINTSQDFLTIPLITAAIVGYVLLSCSRRIGYVIILITTCLMFFEHLSYVTGLMLSNLSKQSNSSTSEIFTELLITGAIALNPVITSIVLHRAWTTEPVKAAPFVNPYIPYPPAPW
jgi:hypothetical protein